MSETIADIILEMRRCADYLPSRQKYVPKLSILAWRNLADRVEAAAKRERGALVAEAEAAKDARNRVAVSLGVQYAERCRECKAKSGNAAAIREALTQVQIGFDGNVLGPIGDVPNDWEIAEAKRLCKVVDSALAKPPRNCDRFADAPSAYAAFITPWKLAGNLDKVPTERDFGDWLFAPAEGGAE